MKGCSSELNEHRWDLILYAGTMATVRLLIVAAVFLTYLSSSSSLPSRPDKPKNCQDACKQKPLDITFVIDSSSSIWPENFTLGLWFVQDFVDIFEVGPDNVRVAVVTYGDRVYTEDAFGFDQYTNKGDLKRAISQITFRGGNATKTGAGIQYMREKFLPKARPGVQRACIVMTDGNSQEPDVTAEQARITRETGLEIFAVGIGHDVTEDELRNIAGVEDHVFVVTSYNLLGTIRSRLAFETCGEEPVPRVVCRDNPIDISLVIDASSSIGTSNFTIGLNFVKSFVESFDVGPDHALFSVITYGNGTYDDTAFDFDTYTEEVNVINAIRNIPYTAGNHTDTGDAIHYMRERQMLPKQRPYAAHIAIVLTDGYSQDWEKTYAEAKEARDAKINMFAIGVGFMLEEEELHEIAGRPEHVFTVANYAALETIKHELDDKTCDIVLQHFNHESVIQK